MISTDLQPGTRVYDANGNPCTIYMWSAGPTFVWVTRDCGVPEHLRTQFMFTTREDAERYAAMLALERTP